MTTNNVTRLLEGRGIAYTVFELPEEKLGAAETARLLGVPPEQVFKTIVAVREARGKPILAVIPGPFELDLRKLAKALGEKKCSLPSEHQAEQLTGLQAGGISPLALLNRGFEVVVDELALLFDEIHVSGGQRGLNLRLPVAALLELTSAITADVVS